MKLLTPLGLLGLIAIAILIIIYIIRPNYQQKFISSTYIWKLSLKYKKKRLPTSKLRNILLIASQILVLAGSSMILAQPNLVKGDSFSETEVIAIIDSSASMRTSSNGKSRFERAVNGVKELAEDIFAKDGIITVILADQKPSFLAQRCGSSIENQTALNASLDELIEKDDAGEVIKTLCSYGSSDMDGAIMLCEEVLRQNPSAKVKIFTDTEYEKLPDGIEVERKIVVDDEEWNAGILDAYATMEDNYYSFHVDVARYGNIDTAEEITLTMKIVGANALDSNAIGVDKSFEIDVPCIDAATQEVVFINWDQYQQRVDSSWSPTQGEDYEVESNDGVLYYVINKKENWIFSYKSILASINVQDSFPEDNIFNIYNGQKEVLKVQYASSLQNSYVSGALAAVMKKYKQLNIWDVQITTVQQGKQPALEGFNFYIFEHDMPQTLPEDGVVLLINPSKEPENAGFKVTMPHPDYDFQKESVALTQVNDHPLLKNITTEKITVSKYKRIESYDGDYIPLMECNSDPILLVKNEGNQKVAVLNFSLHFSNIAILGDFPTLIFNMFEYFIPATTVSNAFDVHEEVLLNSRGDYLDVSYNGSLLKSFGKKAETEGSEEITFPVSLFVDLPGTYEISQTTVFDKNVTERIFVKIPSIESAIWKKEDTLPELYRENNSEKYLEDLMFYFAAGILLFLFIEWWLQSLDAA